MSVKNILKKSIFDFTKFLAMFSVIQQNFYKKKYFKIHFRRSQGYTNLRKNLNIFFPLQLLFIILLVIL